MVDLRTLELSGIIEPRAQTLIQALLAIIAEQAEALQQARAEIQQLRDEINRLNGEQGRPTVKPNTPAAATTATDHSSERERRTPKPWTKRSKGATLTVTREETLRVDPAILPADAVCKGYEDVIVQDLVLTTEVIRFRKEKFYSPSRHQTYLAPLPPGYQGQFGPGLRALALTLYYAGEMSEPKLREFLGSAGLELSEGTLSNLLIQQQAPFHAEKAALYRAGLASSPWQHLDDTGTRVHGQNQSCHIVCNPLYTAYFTLPQKNRLSVIDVLRDLAPRCFRLNAEALTYLAATQLATKTLAVLAALAPDQELDEAELAALLAAHLPGLGDQAVRWIRDAMAVAAYHAQVGYPVVRLLVCDDAPQFKGVTEELGLCWVHEGRHYKKLTPFLAAQRTLLEEFRQQFWDYYRELLAYRAQPTATDAARLEAAFDLLFATQTGYGALDARIAATRGNKAGLLLVLRHPEIPLHNNPAELGARQRVRKRDVSFGPQSDTGRQCWDTFMSLVETAKKLGVSVYAYFQDRVRRAGQIPPFAQLIADRAQGLQLGASWCPPHPTPSY
jgi:Transposase IS66 family